MTDRTKTKCWAGYENCHLHKPFWVLVNGRWVPVDDSAYMDKEEAVTHNRPKAVSDD